MQEKSPPGEGGDSETKELLLAGRSYPLPLCIRRIPGIHYYVKSPAAEFFKIRFYQEKSLLHTKEGTKQRSYSIELRLRLCYLKAQV